MKLQTSFGGYGATPDEEELLGTLLGQSQGPAPFRQAGMTPADFDIEPAAPAPPPPTAAAPTALSAPLLEQKSSFMEPPERKGPPSYTPEPLPHEEGSFGMKDIAMLGAILASAVLGGKHGRQAVPQMIGAYGQQLGQDASRRDQRNAQIDQYNAKQAEQHNPRAQWFEDQEAELAAKQLAARNRGLDLQVAQEERIAKAATAEAAIDPVEQARKIAQARADVELDTTRQRNDMEVGTREKLAEILGKGRVVPGGSHAAPTGKAAKHAKPLTQKQLLDEEVARQKLEGLKSGTLGLDGKPIEKTAKDSTPEALYGTEVENPALWTESAGTAANFEKRRSADEGLTSGVAAFKEMEGLLKLHGSQHGLTQDSAALVGQFDAAKGKVQAAYGVLKNLGVLQPTEAKLIDEAIGADMGYGLADIAQGQRGDVRVGKLEGARKAFENALERARHSYGLKAKGASAAPSGGAKAGPQSGFGEAPSDRGTGDGSGKRTVSMRHSKTGKSETATLTEQQIQSAIAKGWVLQ